MRLSRTFAAVVTLIMTAGMAMSADAQTTYFYTGNFYTFEQNFPGPCATGGCADYTSGMRVVGSFQVQTPLPPNATVDLTIGPNLLDWHFFDGINQLTPANAFPVAFTVATNATGDITTVGTHIQVADYLSGTLLTGGTVNGIEIGRVVNPNILDAVGNNISVGAAPTFDEGATPSTSLADAIPTGAWSPPVPAPALDARGLAVFALLLAAAGLVLRRRRDRMASSRDSC
jgi:hypothetical protein